MTARRVGIERLYVYPGTQALSMELLAKARGADPKHPTEELFMHERSVNPLWEDPVTMGANAARGVLEGIDPASIELLVFGSESSVDFGKPMSTYVQRWAGLGANVRNFETKHACYGGTAGLMMALHWVASGAAPGKKALVVTADQSRAHLGKPWEYVLGACAVAMVISDQPDVVEIDLGRTGYWTSEIHDTYRPTSRHEVGHAETSLFGYLDALEGAYEHYVSKVGEIDYLGRFKKNVYHVPFGGMTWRGHRAMLRRTSSELGNAAMRESWRERTLPSIHYNGRIGGAYTGATFVALSSLIERCDDLNPGDLVSMYSYGSGSMGEFYEAKIGERARELVTATQLGKRLDARTQLTIEQYEALENRRMERIDQADLPDLSFTFDVVPRVWENHYEGQEKVVLESVSGFERKYRLS